jgi:hypothetical protein
LAATVETWKIFKCFFNRQLLVSYATVSTFEIYQGFYRQLVMSYASQRIEEFS